MNKIKTVLFIATVMLFVASTAPATTYYVDSIDGNDAFSGSSSALAWQNLTRVSSQTFLPGDKILLKCGSVWNDQQLWPKGSGSAGDGNSISIDIYGDPANGLPQLNGNGVIVNVLYLYNQQYWDVNSLEITNYRAGDNHLDLSSYKRGVYILAENIGETHHIHLTNLVIHNVNGFYDSSSNGGKDNGGVFIYAKGPAATWFNDILIEGCHIYDVDRGGISNISDWLGRTIDSDAGWYGSTNIVIRNNLFENVCGNGLITRAASTPIIEYNVFYRCGLKISGNAMFTSYSNDPIVQYNEAYEQVYAAGETDAAGFDIDISNKRALFQYNYAHDNGEGAFTVCTNGTVSTYFQLDAVVRYNVCQNNARQTFYCSGPLTNTQFYNNTVYIGSSIASNIIFYINTWGGYADGNKYYNNIIYNLCPSASYNITNGTNVSVDYNVFYGNHPASEPADPHKLTTDPKLINPGSGTIGLDTVDGYKLQPDSPCIDSGMTIANNGGLDYWGNPVPSGSAPDRGAHEFQIISDANDHTPPIPNPMTWQTAPYTVNAVSISMTATTAADPNTTAVQYYFDCLTAGGHDSGWQSSTTYTDSGLSPNTTYTYQVKARDTSPNYNETAYSTTGSAQTPDQQLPLTPEADTFVRGGTYANTAYGTSPTLDIKTNSSADLNRRIFLRFDLSGISGTINSATLRMHASRVDGSTTHNVNFVSSDTWAESITWNTQPSSGATLDSNPITATGWLEYDVTSQVATEAAGDEKISFMLSEQTTTVYCQYDSKEAANSAYYPQLVITTLVDWYDLEAFVAQWLNNCSDPDWCDGYDFNQSGTVNLVDYAILAEKWLTAAP